jgi:hypothetical protein
MGVRAGGILHLAGQKVAGGRRTQLLDVPQHGHRIPGKRSVEVVEPPSPRQNGIRVGAKRLFDHSGRRPEAARSIHDPVRG